MSQTFMVPSFCVTRDHFEEVSCFLHVHCRFDTTKCYPSPRVENGYKSGINARTKYYQQIFTDLVHLYIYDIKHVSYNSFMPFMYKIFSNFVQSICYPSPNFLQHHNMIRRNNYTISQQVYCS